VGEHHPPVGTVDLPAGLDGGDAGETVGIDKRASGGGQSEQVEMVAGWDRPNVVQTGLGQIGKVGVGVPAGVEHHGHLAGTGAGVGVPGEEFLVAAGQFLDQGGESGDVGPVARTGV
jgi:hypothetical protein